MGIAAAALIWLVKSKGKNNLAAFACGWFFICLLPFSNIFPALAFYMSEHSLYLASIGFFLLLAHFLLRLYERKGARLIAGILIAALLLVYGLLTFRQNRYWQDEISLYKRVLIFTKDSPGVYNNLCRAYNANGRYLEAIDACEKAINLRPDFAYAWCYLGNAYRHLSNNPAAMRAYSKAIAFSPRYEYAYNQLGLLYLSQGRARDACAEFQRALEINPGYQDASDNFRRLNCPR
jgi:tetratricopeptide (TPR) repeat protein